MISMIISCPLPKRILTMPFDERRNSIEYIDGVVFEDGREVNGNIASTDNIRFTSDGIRVRIPQAELAGPDTPLDEPTFATFIGQKIKYLVASNIDAVFSMSGKAIAGCEVEFLCAEEDKLYTVSMDCSGENVELDVDYGEPDPAVMEKINECQSRHLS